MKDSKPNGRKAGFFRQRDSALTDAGLFHERAGIYAEFGKIIVIAIGKLVENENGERCLKTKYFCASSGKNASGRIQSGHRQNGSRSPALCPQWERI